MTRTILSVAPGALGADTFSAAGTRTYIDANGVVQTAAVNVVRDAHYEQGARTVLLEGSGTNLVTVSEQFDAAAWTRVAAAVTANALAAPSGAATADKLVEDTSATAQHRLDYVSTLAAGTACWSLFAKAAGRTKIELRIGLNGATFDLSAGTVSSIAGGYTASTIALGSGWYRCWIAGACALNDTVRVNLLDASGNITYTGDGASGAYLWGAQVEQTALGRPSSYIATAGAAVTRSPDLIGWTIPDAPHAMEWAVEFFEHGAVSVANDGIAYLGQDVFGNARFQITTLAGRYQCAHNNGAVSVVSNTPIGTAPAIGARVRLRAVLYSDGAVELFQSVNGGAEVSGGRSAANPLAAAWSAQTFRLNSIGSTNQGNAAYLSATLTDLSVHHPSISFTDAQGLVTITAQGPTLNNWQPDVADYPPAVNALGTGVSHQLPLRTDYLASFELPNIAPAQFGDLLRFKRWIANGGGTGTGGTFTVNTADNQLRSYICTVAPGTLPSWTFDDRRLLEYTLHVTARNTAAAPMLCDYSPT